MKIAVTSQGTTHDSPIDTRFGRAQYFLVHDDQTGTWESISNEQNMQAAQGAGIQAATTVANAGCTVLITGHCGPKAYRTLRSAGIDIYTSKAVTVDQALAAFLQGTLHKLDQADVEGHW
jgi:predicted Fe-Mo cluster-binding NifX family protein